MANPFDRLLTSFDTFRREMDDFFKDTLKDLDVETKTLSEGTEKVTITNETLPDGTKRVTHTVIRKTTKTTDLK
jgi:hypothetical protein